MSSDIFVPPGSQLAEFLALCERFGLPVRVENGPTQIHVRPEGGGIDWWVFNVDGTFAGDVW